MTSLPALRHRVETAAAPRLTPQQSCCAKKSTAPEAVLLDGVEEILRAGGRKTAAGVWARDCRKYGRERELVGAHEEANEEAHQGRRIEARLARRNHSS